MKIRNLLFLVLVGFLVLISAGATYFGYQVWLHSLESGIDQELLTAANLARDVLPAHYHDQITGPDSVTDAEYLQIVDRFNTICKETGMEYLWSLMILEGKTVFTSATSPGKDASKRDQAGFLEVHSNPELYTRAFETMQPQFQVNDDKWGRIRVVLVPFYDAQGRKFLIGASRRMQEVDAETRMLLNSSLLFGGIVIAFGALISYMLANSLTRPIDGLKVAAAKIAAGDYSGQALAVSQAGPYREVASLAHSFEIMKETVRTREAALQKSEAQYRLLTENIKDVVWILDTETMYFRYISPSVERLRGYTPGEVLSQPLTQAFSAEASERMVNLTRRRAEDVLAGREPAGKFYTEEVEQPCKDGTSVYTEVITSYYINPESGKVEARGVSRDISERKWAEAALRESEEKYRTVAEFTYDWESWLAPDGSYHYISPSCERISGHTATEFLVNPQLMLQITHPDDQSKIMVHHYAVGHEAREQNLELDFRIITPYGEIRWIAHSCTAVYASDGQYLGRRESNRDITTRKKVEEQVQADQIELKRLLIEAEHSRHALLSVVEDQKEAQEQIRQLNAELEKRVADRTAQLTVSNQELEAFSYSVSHDLRAPLRALDGFSTALIADYQEQLDQQGQHYLARIQEASRRMGQLIEDLLNLSRITRREMKLEWVDFSAVACQVAAELQAQALAGGRQVEFEVTPGLKVRADSNLIKIILENLMRNAFKFTGQRTQARIQVGMLDQSGERVFFVRDNGAGFNMAYVNKLFIPFQRLHGIHEFPGTGIGLTIVQRIVARHGGRIWPEAAVDAGAIFYFTLG